MYLTTRRYDSETTDVHIHKPMTISKHFNSLSTEPYGGSSWWFQWKAQLLGRVPYHLLLSTDTWRMAWQRNGAQIPGRLVVRATKFCVVAPSIFSVIIAVLGAFATLREVTIRFMSVRPPAQNTSTPAERILIKFELSSKICRQNSSFIKIRQEWRVFYTKTVFTFTTVSRWILVRMKMVLGKSCRENQTKHTFTCSIHVVYKTMSKNVVQPDRPEMTIKRTRFACWVRLHTPQYYVTRTLPVLSPLHEKAFTSSHASGTDNSEGDTALQNCGSSTPNCVILPTCRTNFGDGS
jgi:hypothetical protein